jgi:hypothetical protein
VYSRLQNILASPKPGYLDYNRLEETPKALHAEYTCILSGFQKSPNVSGCTLAKQQTWQEG